jgi:sarcosine oxidase delta subunit
MTEIISRSIFEKAGKKGDYNLHEIWGRGASCRSFFNVETVFSAISSAELNQAGRGTME